MLGEVINLDRKYPLVRCGKSIEESTEFRCEESAAIKKNSDVRCVIGDIVEVSPPGNHDFGIIEKIMPRKTSFVRRDPVDRTSSQVLAANFTQVVIIEPIDRLNIKRIERELVLAHQTGAKVAILLSKGDLASEKDKDECTSKVAEVAGSTASVYVVSINDPDSLKAALRPLFADETSILLGQSGAGKSSLTNLLAGRDAQATGEVRAVDGKGRHTTVARSIIDIPTEDGRLCRLVDMPGVRGLGLFDAQSGIESAFEDIVCLSQNCRFRDCEHINEPGCAVKQAVEDGSLAQARLQSYLELKAEVDTMLKRRERSNWKNK